MYDWFWVEFDFLLISSIQKTTKFSNLYICILKRMRKTKKKTKRAVSFYHQNRIRDTHIMRWNMILVVLLHRSSVSQLYLFFVLFFLSSSTSSQHRNSAMAKQKYEGANHMDGGFFIRFNKMGWVNIAFAYVHFHLFIKQLNKKVGTARMLWYLAMMLPAPKHYSFYTITVLFGLFFFWYRASIGTNRIVATKAHALVYPYNHHAIYYFLYTYISCYIKTWKNANSFKNGLHFSATWVKRQIYIFLLRWHKANKLLYGFFSTMPCHAMPSASFALKNIAVWRCRNNFFFVS